MEHFSLPDLSNLSFKSVSSKEQTDTTNLLEISQELRPRDTHCIAVSLNQLYLYQTENDVFNFGTDPNPGPKVIVYSLTHNRHCGRPGTRRLLPAGA